MDSLTYKVDSLTREVDSLTRGVDSLTRGVDSLTRGVDSLTRGVDSLTRGVDSLTRKVDFLTAESSSRGSPLLFLSSVFVFFLLGLLLFRRTLIFAEQQRLDNVQVVKAEYCCSKRLRCFIFSYGIASDRSVS